MSADRCLLVFRTRTGRLSRPLSLPETTVRRLLILSLFASLALAADLPDPLDAGWNGNAVCKKLHEDARQRVLRCVFPPGGGHVRHFHAAHFGYILEGGRMQITDASGTRVQSLTSGASWTSDGVAWHEVLNVGETTSSYLIVEPK